jgi:hypothetical protein
MTVIDEPVTATRLDRERAKIRKGLDERLKMNVEDRRNWRHTCALSGFAAITELMSVGAVRSHSVSGWVVTRADAFRCSPPNAGTFGIKSGHKNSEIQASPSR